MLEVPAAEGAAIAAVVVVVFVAAWSAYNIILAAVAAVVVVWCRWCWYCSYCWCWYCWCSHCRCWCLWCFLCLSGFCALPSAQLHRKIFICATRTPVSGVSQARLQLLRRQSIDESMSKDSCPVIQSTVSRTICGQVRRSPAIATGRKLAGGLS